MDGNPQLGVVIIDACFSGGSKNQPLLANKGIKVKPKEEPIPEKIVVLTSSSGDESSNVFEEKQHGYFTYYLLKKLQESKGKTTFGDLLTYVKKNVRKETSLIGNPQTPEIKVNDNISDEWQKWEIVR